MKQTNKKPSPYGPILLAILVGSFGIWDGLVQIATHVSPTFGSSEKYDPKWAAGVVVIGVIFVAIGISFLVAVTLKIAWDNRQHRD